MGFFLAVLLGAVFSSFNSLLNSIATLFVLDIYKLKFKPNATDQDLIRVSKWFGTFVALVSFFVAPNLMYAPDGLWDLIRRFTGFFNIPILVIVLIGMLVKRVRLAPQKSSSCSTSSHTISSSGGRNNGSVSIWE